ncbi:MAG: 4-(cytidine 5'-diphospho)-2-C-methyl-D-erythritol kinase [Candidatus Melainabacteria bacterium GWF2_32_7]|nr:MAG: 4-(cytidine 5'-diphospho)-2-C-methyl-D-erythritol kinase [Candidatus Melainabacteria bacterium GWF2_32_7]
MQIQVQTPAKINLILEVLKKREDGFHEIQSIMQAVSLYDCLNIEASAFVTVKYTKEDLPHFDGDKSKFNKSITAFYKDCFQNKTVIHPELGEIKLYNIGIEKTIKYNHAENLKLIIKIDKLIQNAKYIGTETSYKDRIAGIFKFHILFAKADIDGEIIDLEIKISEDKFGKKYYFYKNRSLSTFSGKSRVTETSNYIITDENKNLNPIQNKIELSGNSDQIPYDKTNLVYKAADLFLKKANLKGFNIKIYIEKNIPVAAGLAGGSSNAAGTLWGLNRIFENILSSSEIHELASQMGSDLNFCLEGGTQVTTSRGEILSRITTPDLNIVIIKPKNLFISAKEAYEKWDLRVAFFATLSAKNATLSAKNAPKNQIKKENKILSSQSFIKLLNNNLEEGILPDYPEIQEIKDYLIQKGCKNALMSGSGPSVFGIYEGEIDLSDARPDWECFKVKTIDFGIIPLQK